MIFVMNRPDDDGRDSHEQIVVPGGNRLALTQVPLAAQTAELCRTRGKPAVRTDCIIYYVVRRGWVGLGRWGCPLLSIWT